MTMLYPSIASRMASLGETVKAIRIKYPEYRPQRLATAFIPWPGRCVEAGPCDGCEQIIDLERSHSVGDFGNFKFLCDSCAIDFCKECGEKIDDCCCEEVAA